MLPKPGRFSVGVDACAVLDPIAKLPKAPIGENAPPWVLEGQGDGLVPPMLAVVLRLSPPKGADSAARDLSLSRSSLPGPSVGSFKSVRRLSRAGGGVVVFGSSLEKRETVLGDVIEVGKGYASLVSRRRFPGRVDVGEERPKAGLF